MAKRQLFLIDDTFMGLAPLVTRQIFDIIKPINEEHNTTIFHVEQNANFALNTADRFYVLENGTIDLHNQVFELLINNDIQKAYFGTLPAFLTENLL